MASNSVVEEKKTDGGSKLGSSLGENFTDEVSSKTISNVTQLVDQIDGLTTEIDSLASKGVVQANTDFANEGKIVVNTKASISSLQDGAPRLTASICSAFEEISFSDETAKEVEEAANNGDVKPLEAVINTVNENIRAGSTSMSTLDTLCKHTESYGVATQQLCENHIKQLETNKLRGNVFTFTLAQISFVAALVVGAVGAVITYMQTADQPANTKNILTLAVAVFIMVCLVAFGIARIVMNKQSSAVYKEAMASISVTRDVVMDLQIIAEDFMKTKRDIVAHVDEVSHLIGQYSKEQQNGESHVSSDYGTFVTNLQRKCQELHDEALSYRTRSDNIINRLDDLDNSYRKHN